jgi:hypothetical protein
MLTQHQEVNILSLSLLALASLSVQPVTQIKCATRAMPAVNILLRQATPTSLQFL